MSNVTIIESLLTDGSPVYDVAVSGHVVHYAHDERDALRVAEALRVVEECNNARLTDGLALALNVAYYEARPTVVHAH